MTAGWCLTVLWWIWGEPVENLAEPLVSDGVFTKEGSIYIPVDCQIVPMDQRWEFFCKVMCSRHRIALVRLLELSCWQGLGLIRQQQYLGKSHSYEGAAWRGNASAAFTVCTETFGMCWVCVCSSTSICSWVNSLLLLDFSNFIVYLTNSQRQRRSQSCALWAWRASHCTTWRATSRFDSFP